MNKDDQFDNYCMELFSNYMSNLVAEHKKIFGEEDVFACSSRLINVSLKLQVACIGMSLNHLAEHEDKYARMHQVMDMLIEEIETIPTAFPDIKKQTH